MKQYFYDEKTGEYTGQTNCRAPAPAGSVVSDMSPDDKAAEQAADGTGQAVDKKAARTAAYAIKAAAYSDHQIHGALIRAKGFKREVLLAEKAKREQ